MSRVRGGGLVAVGLSGAVLLGAADRPKSDTWVETPTHAQVAAAWPAAAVAKDPASRASMVCKTQADGTLTDCRVTVERPGGMGVGQAMLSLAPRYRLNMRGSRHPRAGEDFVVSETVATADQGANWLRRPTSEDLETVWPKEAWAHGQEGQATVNCLVSLQGALFDCAVAEETPKGAHFGDAALALTPQFLMKPAMQGGQPVVSPVSIPIKFAMAPGLQRPILPGETAKVASANMAWRQAPSYAEVAAAYPARARAARLGGRATLVCAFDKQGALHQCDVLAEEPKRDGFAEAAKTLAKRFRAYPTTSDGKGLAGARVQLPVVFDPSMLDHGQPVIGKAQWAVIPSSEDTIAAFGKLSVTGTTRVMLACTVQQGGAVSDCKVASEDPAGQGVGAAALSLSPHFRLTTWTAEGLPTVGGTIDIPLRYVPDPPKPAG